jgi:mono/diheme cytochrome c family protein
MKRTSQIAVLVGILLIAATLLAACGSKATPTVAAGTEAPTTAPATQAPTAAPELVGDPIRGGRLYDIWFEELGVDPPTDVSALWTGASTQGEDAAPEDTYLCAACHGFDYQGDNGFVGIAADAGKDPNEILAILKGSTDPNHDFSTYMDDQALADLALFVSNEQIDVTTIVADGKPVNGVAENGKTLFGDNCTDCHGPQGLGINFQNDSAPEYPSSIANEDPVELLTKLRFGQPGVEKMPSGIDNSWTDQDYADAIAYIAGLPDSSPVAEGGRMYDDWITANAATAPEGNQPLWTGPLTSGGEDIAAADTWRCSSCHGWDYKGDNDFATDLLAARTKSSEELLAAITGKTDPQHDFTAQFTAPELDAMVAFIQNAVVDKTPYINADGTAIGDAAHGKQLYNSICKSCHGDDGKELNFQADEGGEEFLATVAIDNAWEFFNKTSIGQPGEAMPAGLNLGWSLQDFADVLAYAQTLPAK